MKITAVELVGLVAVCVAASLATGDALSAAALFVLWLGFKLLVTGDGLVVLFLAFTYQWMQVTLGVFYSPLTGRALATAGANDWRRMVELGLLCITALAVGIRFGIYLVRRRPEPSVARPEFVLSWPLLITLYVIAVIADPVLNSIAQVYTGYRQILITAMVIRLGLLFLIARRLAIPRLRWNLLLLLMLAEIARGFTGYFAGFREPLIIGGIVLLEVFDRRKLTHWASAATVLALMILTSVMWMGVRTTYRAEMMEVDALAQSQQARFNRISDLGSTFFRGDLSDLANATDALADRLWAVYYPALAIERVPDSVPRTNGELIKAAVIHVVTPRLFFPDKPNLISDSELVRKYAGVYVAGAEQNTSIAFGYVVESYIDFAPPLMFLPTLIFGALMGLAYAWLVRHLRHVELMIATVNVIFWLALYLFERSWANTLGNAMSLLVYLAIPVALVDDFLLVRFVLRQNSREQAAV